MSALADGLSHTPDDRTPDGTPRARTNVGDGSEAWRWSGLVAGVQGAAAVALFFLLIDLASGRPMWTPSSLGARLFQGETLDPSVGWVPVLALGYTLVHGAVFLGIGSIASQVAANRKPGSVSTWLLALILFIAIEITFVAFALAVHPELFAELGAGSVALANLVAAIVMAMSIQRGLKP